MKIKLHEIPEEGRSYHFDRQTAELNQVLADLIQNEAYSVDLFIKPLNTRDYSLSGTIKTKTAESCSRCGDAFKFPVSRKIKDILIPKQDDSDRTGRYAKTSVSEDDDTETVEYVNGVFEIGDYVHESIAIEVPFNPMPETKKNGDCSLCDRPKSAEPIVYDENLGVEKKNPFASLKNMKLN